jgi:uncharacterized protein
MRATGPIRVSRLSIAPVRSLGLQHPASIELTEVGVVEDRRFYLEADGWIVDRISAGRLVQIAASTDPGATWLRLGFPDGRVLEGPVELGEAVETRIHGRIGIGHVVVGPWAAAIEPFAGRPIRLVRCDQPGGTRRGNSVSLIGDGSISRLAQQAEVEAMDSRRFRMLIELEGAAPHAEDGWIGGRIAICSAELAITKADARCAITMQDPETGLRDLETLRAIIDYRGLSPDRKALFGVLGDVVVPGTVSLGDEVRLVEVATAEARLALAGISDGP